MLRDITPARRALIVLSHLTEPGDFAVGHLVSELGAVGAYQFIRDTPMLERDQSPETFDMLRRTKPRLHDRIVDETLAACERAGIEALTAEDVEWPAEEFAPLGDQAPHVLYVRGNTWALSGERPHRVAIVGARAATSYGEHVAHELAADLSKDHVIVSGAAYGIDGAAHRAALAAGGQTVAFLAGGCDRPYPAGHANMIERIAASGAVVSEVPPGSSPTKWRFLQRNRLIAALGDASIVVEAGWRSGSLNEAGHARAFGRPVGAVPGPITSAASGGTHRLIQESGAHLITSAADVRALTFGDKS